MSKMMRSSETPSVIISTQSKTDNDMTGLIKNMEAKHGKRCKKLLPVLGILSPNFNQINLDIIIFYLFF